MGTRLSGNELRAGLLVPFEARRGSVLATVERVVIRLNQTVFVVGRDNSGPSASRGSALTTSSQSGRPCRRRSRYRCPGGCRRGVDAAGDLDLLSSVLARLMGACWHSLL